MLDSTFLTVLYYLIFFAWIPLGLMAYASRHSRARFGSLLALAALSVLVCAYVLYMDFVWSKTVAGPIRIDLLLLIPAFSGLNLALGIWGLIVWRGTRSGVMLLSSVSLLLPAAPILVAFWISMRSAERTGAQIDSIPALLFEAQFKNADNFHKTFGDVDGTPLAGHYQAEPGVWATRVIINSEGHLWLYFTCDRNGQHRTECIHSDATIEGGTSTFPHTISLDGHVGTVFEGDISSEGDGRFTLAVETVRDGVKRPYLNPVTFRRSPVDFRAPEPSSADVKYWGGFAQSTVRGNSIEPIQLWLWQQGPRFMAFYVRNNLECGKSHAFISPQFLEGELKDDGLMLAKPKAIESLMLSRMTPQELTGSVWYGGRPFEDVVLRPKTMFAGDHRFEVAPLADFEQTRTWLKTVSLGYMFTWNAECASP